MARTSFPPGFRFHPTDVELVKYYLKRKVMGKSLQFDAISELNIYKYSPWDLADKSCLRSKDLEWYFFCPNERKYASGARTNRATESGYWKSTGKDRPVLYKEQSVGMVKTLVYHIGHAPKGERTDWVMYEYRIEDKELADAGTVQDAYVLCKVFQKSGPGPKANAQYGVPFCEEDWDDDAEFCGLSLPSNSLLPPVLPYNNSISVGTSMFIPESTFSGPSSKPSPSNVLPSSDEVLPAFPDNEDFICLSDIAKDNNFMLPNHTVNNEVGESFSDKNNIEGLTCMDGDEMGYGFGDLDIWLELSGGGFNENNSEGLTCLDVDGMDYSLGDLENWPELSGGGFSFPINQTTNYDGIPFVAGDIEFLELNDLNAPLNFHTDATRSQDSLTDILYEPFYNNNNGGDYLPVDMFDAAQDFSILDQLFPLLPEGYNGHGDHFDLLEENSGVTESADLGFTASSCDGTPGEQPEDETGRHAGEDNNRGQRISYTRLQQLLESIPAHHSTYGGSSIHVKAEVTPSVVGALKTLCSQTWGSLYLKTVGATSSLRVWEKKWLNCATCFWAIFFVDII